MQLKTNMKKLSWALLCLAFSGPALAQQELNLRSQGIRPYTVEIKPIPTALSAEPGVGSVGAGAEMFLGSKTALFVNGQYLDAALKANVVQQARSSNPGEPVPTAIYGYKVVSGLRYYAAPAYSSWYGEAAAGYSEATGKWDYNDATIDSRIISLLPTLGAGYRWIFGNNALIRVGAEVSQNVVKGESTTTEVDTPTGNDGERRVRNIQRTATVAALDVGLGYAF